MAWYDRKIERMMQAKGNNNHALVSILMHEIHVGPEEFTPEEFERHQAEAKHELHGKRAYDLVYGGEKTSRQ